MSDRVPTLISSVLARAVSHPTRLGAMTILLKGDATPAQIADELGEPLSNVSYHIEILENLGCIQLVRVEPAGGGRVVRHLYRAVERGYFDQEAWEQLSAKEKLRVVMSIMQLVSADINEAMFWGTFFEPDDNHLSRSPMNVDLEGWKEVVALLDGTVDGLFEIEERVTERAASGNQETFSIKVAIIQFQSPEHP